MVLGNNINIESYDTERRKQFVIVNGNVPPGFIIREKFDSLIITGLMLKTSIDIEQQGYVYRVILKTFKELND